MPSRFTYSRWDGTQVGFELDADDIFSEITDDLLYHGDLNAALRRMLQSGFRRPQRRAHPGHPGDAREAAPQAPRRARALRPRRRLRRHRPGAARRRRHGAGRRSTSSPARRRSRATPAARRSPTRSCRSATCSSTCCRPTSPARCKDLQEYEFTSQRGAGEVRGAGRPAPPAAHAELLQPDGRGDEQRRPRQTWQRMKDMLAELNDMLEARQAGRGHARLRASSWSATATSSPRTRRTSTSCSRSWRSAWRPCRRC